MTKFYDEQAEQDEFVRIVGGYQKADRLQYIRNNSYPKSQMYGQKSADEVFRENATKEGFTKKQIDAFNKLR